MLYSGNESNHGSQIRGFFMEVSERIYESVHRNPANLQAYKENDRTEFS